MACFTARVLEIVSSGSSIGQTACEQLVQELPGLLLAQLTNPVAVGLVRMGERCSIVGCRR